MVIWRRENIHQHVNGTAPTGLPVDDYEEDEISLITDKVFQHIFKVYPTLPSPIYC
jgi:hypothetical protein